MNTSVKNFLLSILVSGVFFEACTTSKTENLNYKFQKTDESENGLVVTAHPLASEAGVKILRLGGNAVDAAIAVQLALTVVYPEAGNIGGGGFMVYTSKDGVAATLDFREKAFSLSTRDMYLDSLGEPLKELSTSGHLSVGIPGTVDGIFAMFNKYSKLKDIETLFKPAIMLAEQGFRITQREADNLNATREQFLKINKDPGVFVKDVPWKKGDILVQTQLAETLRRIAKNGRTEFYEGKTAELLVKCIENNNGIINKTDLKEYRSEWRRPMTAKYKNCKIITMAPPSSGGIVLIQMLKMLEPFDLRKMGFHSTEYIHLLIEVERRAYADRAAYLGDPTFVKVPVSQLIDSGYLSTRMRGYNPIKASPSKLISAGIMPLPHESQETTHFSIIDKEGNAVSLTTTLNSGYGSKVVVPGAGFILNNEMDDFSIKPGTPNQFGLVGAEANAIQPGKRMLSSMTPTIVMKNDEIYAIIGSPGGATIITTVLQVLLNLIEHEMSPFEAVQASRFHSQWLPDIVNVEKNAFSAGIQNKLKEMGHELKTIATIGKVEAIVRKHKNSFIGVADRRGDDDVEIVK